MAINVFNPRNRVRPDQRTPQQIDDTIVQRPADTVTPPSDIQTHLGGVSAPGGRAPSAPEVTGDVETGLGVDRFNVAPHQFDKWQQEQGQRLGTPTEIPNFADYSTLERGAAEIGRPLSVIPNIQHRQREEDRRKGQGFGDTAITEDAFTSLKALAKSNEDALLWSDEAYTEQGQIKLATIANAFDIPSQENLDRLGDVSALTTLRVADKVNRFGYERQVAAEEGAKHSEQEKAVAKAKSLRARLASNNRTATGKSDESTSPKRKEQVAQALRNNLHNEPVLKGLLTDYANFMDQGFNPEKGSSTYNQESIFGGDPNTRRSQSKLAAAADMMKRDMDLGLLGFLVNDKGQLVPTTTESSNQLLQGGGLDIVSVYDAEVRQGSVARENLIQAQPFPSIQNELFGLQSEFSKAPNRVDWSKVDGMKLSRIAMSISDNVGYGQHATSIALQQAMAAEIVPGENGRFNSTLSELSANDYQGYVAAAQARKAEDPEAQAQEVLDNKAAQIQKAFQTYANRAERMKQYSTTALYGTLSKSVTTGRVNETASDVNLGADKGMKRMAHTWGNNASIQLGRTGSNLTKTQEVERIVDKVANKFRDLPPGEAYGWTLNQRLQGLTDNELMIADTLYAIGTSLDNGSGGSRIRPTDADGNPITNPDDGDYIRHGLKHLGVASQRGAEVLTWAQNQKMPDQLPGWFHNKKGEWAWDTTIYEDAYNLKNYMDNINARPPVMRHVVEHDASQSNAFIMSTLIGDTRTMNLLGAALDMPPGTWNMYGGQKPDDLRKALMETIDQDIDRAFNNGEDAEVAWVRDNIRTYIGDMKQEALENGDKPDKVYGRLIVVAGLYGKATIYMYSEVRDMLSQVPNAKAKLLAKYKLKYPDQDYEKMMIDDLATLYSQSAQTNMAELFNFQYAIKKLVGVKAAVNGSGILPGIAANEKIDVEYTQWNPHWENDLNSKISNLLAGEGFAPEQVTTGNVEAPVGDIRPEKGLQAAHGWRDYEDKPEAKMGAESSINAAPPSIIQNGDWYGLMLTYLISNMDNNGDIRQVPRNIKTIHDAVLSGAGSTLISKNVYNNIFPHQVAKAAQGKNGQNELAYFNRLIKSMNDDIDRALEKVEADGGAIIGTQGEWHGITDYFDRLWFNQKDVGSERQAGWQGQESVDPEVRRENNKVLALAKEKGWLPPIESNKDARRGRTVTPEDFAALVELIVESNKVQTNEPVYGKSVIGGSVSYWTDWMKKTTEKRVPEMIEQMAKLGRSINNLKR